VAADNVSVIDQHFVGAVNSDVGNPSASELSSWMNVSRLLLQMQRQGRA